MRCSCPETVKTTPLPFAKAPICVTFTPAARDAASRAARFRARHGDRQFIVVAASQHVAPERQASPTARARAAADNGTRSRSICAASPDASAMWPTSASRPSEMSAVARGDADEPRPQRRARLRQAIALLQDGALQLATRRQQAERGIADRAAHPELVPCPRAVAAQPLAARDPAEGGDRDRGRARRAGRVAAAQHDAEAALVGGEPARESGDPALGPAARQATARADRRTASRRPPRDRTGRRATRARRPARASRRRGNARPTRSCRSSRRDRAADRPRGRRCRS